MKEADVLSRVISCLNSGAGCTAHAYMAGESAFIDLYSDGNCFHSESGGYKNHVDYLMEIICDVSRPIRMIMLPTSRVDDNYIVVSLNKVKGH